MDVILYTNEHKEAWEEFVLTHPKCSLYHRLGWKEVIENSYHHKCFYLLAKKKAELTGILPLVLIRSRIFGCSLTSLPFVDSAGIMAKDEETQKSLLDKAIQLGMEQKAGYLELRQIEALKDNLKTDTRKVTLTLELKSDTSVFWKSLPSERRNRINKAKKSNLHVEFGGKSLLPIFYQVWAENMRDLGSPAHSILFFENVLEAFSSFVNIILVKHNQAYIGGAICLWFKDRFSVPWVSSLRNYYELYPNNLLYWQAMILAASKGCRIFDFGRSTVGSGTYTFKARWGAKEEQLFWQFKTLHGKDITILSTEAPKYRLAVALWKKMPVGISKFIGPKIRKFITA